jgi:hypothetical protein
MSDLTPIEIGDDVILAEHARMIRLHGGRIISDVVEIGRRLVISKDICGHGNWLPWLEREFGWSDSTALKYMQSYRFVTDKSISVTDLKIGVKSLFALSAPSNPEAARDEVIERSEAGERMTPAQIKGIVRRGCRPRQNR